jgi:two-component system, chemotaxis family, chemotaxis protein CheY
MADRKMRVLIVDDANLVRLYDRQILEEAGFDVDEALNGLEALERLLVSRADALIVDINMPQMDGITFLAALKRQALPLSSIPALVASTESNLSDVVARAPPAPISTTLSRSAATISRATIDSGWSMLRGIRPSSNSTGARLTGQPQSFGMNR